CRPRAGGSRRPGPRSGIRPAAGRQRCQTLLDTRMLEALREQQGYREVADEQDGDHQTDRVLCAHSRSTPRTITAENAKNATVIRTNTTSDIQGLQSLQVTGRRPPEQSWTRNRARRRL